MVEGHQCHRVAAAHRRLLVGRSFQARSPNGRFQEGAAAINAKPLQRIEVHGKNLFYFFGAPPPAALLAPAPAVPAPAATPATAVGAAGAGASTAAGAATAAAAVTTRGPRGARKRAAEAALQATFASAPVLAEPAADDAAAGDEIVVVHIHFGMSGAFRTMTLPGPAPTETTRLELINKEMGLVAHLSAMTVAHGSLALYRSKAPQLGPDPLREDADKELLWSKLARCRKPIGLVLMDQSMLAGVGNIYRAEILFKAGVHPETPAAAISRQEFDRIWYHSVDLLQRGFVTGSIITVDPAEATRLGRPWNRRYIYNQKQCGRCKGPVRTWDMAARTVYCCEKCQPLRLGPPPEAEAPDAAAAAGVAAASGSAAAAVASVALSPARLAAMAASRPARVFRSHCAPDDPEDAGLVPEKLTVPQLKARLTALNLDTRGKKAALVERLAAAVRWEKQPQSKTEDKEQPREKMEEAETEDKEEVAAAALRAAPSGSEDVVVFEDEEESDDEEENDDVVLVEEEDGKGREGKGAGSAAPPAAAAAAVSTPTVGAGARRRRTAMAAAETTAAAAAAATVAPAAEGAAEAAIVIDSDDGAREGTATVTRGSDGSDGGDGGGDASDSGSEEALDRAERVLTDSMAADTPGDDPASPHEELLRLSVVQLKARLKGLGLPTSGTKSTLQERLKAAALAVKAAAAAAGGAGDGAAAPPATPPKAAAAAAMAAAAATPARADAAAPLPPLPRTPKRPRKAKASFAEDEEAADGRRLSPVSPLGIATLSGSGGAAATPKTTTREPAGAAPVAGRTAGAGGGAGMYDIRPGIRGLEARMASARDAALEKLLAGENRAVEHVALEDEEVVDLLAEVPTGRGRARKRAAEAAAAIEAAAAAMEGGEEDVEVEERRPQEGRRSVRRVSRGGL